MTKNLSLLSLVVLPLMSSAAVELLEPADGAVVPLLTPAQKAYVSLEPSVRRQKFADPDFRRKEMGLPAEVADGVTRKSWWPQTVRLSWRGAGAGPVRVQVREADGGALFADLTTTNAAAVLDNFKIGTRYVWSVDDGSGAVSRGFATEATAPRLLRDLHVPNVRDLGGRIGLDGRRVRQGRIIRSAGLNENASAAKTSEAQIKQLDPKGAIAALEPEQKKLFEFWAKTFGATRPDFVSTTLDNWRVEALAAGLSAQRAAAIFAERVKGEPGEASSPAVRAADGILRLGQPGDGKWCHVTGELMASGDGVALLDVSADWYWALAVNGVAIRDQLVGNKIAPDGEPHHLAFPVRAGRNALSLVVGSGSQGFYLKVTPGSQMTRDATFERERRFSREMMTTLVTHANGYKKGATRIHDDNRAFWLGFLGIRTDIDLRSDRECFGMTGSPLGDTVAWQHVSSSAYEGLQRDGGRIAFAKVFRVFLDERNYPIDFHCIAGQDRTGAVAFVLNALLGVDEEALALDWDVTGFWNRSASFCHARLYDRLVAKMRECHPAPTLRESVESYVRSLGFTDDDIAHFRDLMLEK